MSSYLRRLQIRSMKKAGGHKQLVLSEEGKPLGRRWPVRKGQIFFLNDVPIMPGTHHPKLQPVIDALSAS